MFPHYGLLLLLILSHAIVINQATPRCYKFSATSNYLLEIKARASVFPSARTRAVLHSFSLTIVWMLRQSDLLSYNLDSYWLAMKAVSYQAHINFSKTWHFSFFFSPPPSFSRGNNKSARRDTRRTSKWTKRKPKWSTSAVLVPTILGIKTSMIVSPAKMESAINNTMSTTITDTSARA